MHPVRRLVILVVGLALVLGGAYLLFLQVTSSHIIYGWALFGGGFAIVIGVYLLWQDIVAPLVRGKDAT